MQPVQASGTATAGPRSGHRVLAGLTRSIGIAAVILAAGCGSTSGTHASQQAALPHGPAALYQSPEQATLSWFYAINHKNMAAALAHFEPSDRNQMNWGNGNTATWSTFSRLHCKPTEQGNGAAQIYCTFSESPSQSEGNPDTWWDVYLVQRHGDWLISGYGQG
jgi:hypothetical protein